MVYKTLNLGCIKFDVLQQPWTFRIKTLAAVSSSLHLYHTRLTGHSFPTYTSGLFKFPMEDPKVMLSSLMLLPWEVKRPRKQMLEVGFVPLGRRQNWK